MTDDKIYVLYLHPVNRVAAAVALAIPPLVWLVRLPSDSGGFIVALWILRILSLLLLLLILPLCWRQLFQRSIAGFASHRAVGLLALSSHQVIVEWDCDESRWRDLEGGDAVLLFDASRDKYVEASPAVQHLIQASKNHSLGRYRSRPLAESENLSTGELALLLLVARPKDTYGFLSRFMTLPPPAGPPYDREWMEDNLKEAPLGLWATDDGGSGVPWGMSMTFHPDGRIHCTYHSGFSGEELNLRWRAKEPWVIEVARVDEDVWFLVPYEIVDTENPRNKEIRFETDLAELSEYGFLSLMYCGMRFD